MTSRVKRNIDCFRLSWLRLMALLAFSASSVCEANAETIGADSTQANFLDRISNTRLFQATYLGVPLIAGGLIEKHQDTKFRKLRNDFMPQFQRPQFPVRPHRHGLHDRHHAQ